MQFFDCAYEHLTEPVYIWFPFGLTYLAAIAIGAAVGWLLGNAAYRIFGWYFKAVRPGIRLDRQCCLVHSGVVPPASRCWRAGGGGDAGAGKAGRHISGGSHAGLDEAEKALTGRRKEGD